MIEKAPNVIEYMPQNVESAAIGQGTKKKKKKKVKVMEKSEGENVRMIVIYITSPSKTKWIDQSRETMTSATS